MSIINENIRKFRELRKMTQKQFAEQLRKSRNVISNWERGENMPDADTIEQICRLLSVTPNQLYGWEPCPDYERYKERMQMFSGKIQQLSLEKARIEKELEDTKKQMETEIFSE